MTDRLSDAARRVAELAQPPEIREPWLAYNQTLVEILNLLRLDLTEIKSLLHGQAAANQTAIAMGLKEFAAADELARGATEAALRQEISALALRRAEDTAKLRGELDQRHAELLAALARVSGRQARRNAKEVEG